MHTRMLALAAICVALACSKEADAKDKAKPKRQPLVSVYVGNAPEEIPKFERWFGRHVDGHQVHTGKSNWEDWQRSIPWEVHLWSGLDRPIFWSIPLFPEGANLEEAAKGMYDEHYRQAADVLAEASRNRARIYIRTGWEFNANWMPWTALGKGALYAESYRHFVDAFRSVSKKFVFEWTPNHGDHGMDPADAYPGDKYVDIIGMDFYYDLEYDNPDPIEAFRYKVNADYGLQWLEDFAKKHKKPTAYAEWGVMSEKAGPYVEEAAKWFAAHDVVYHSYWNSNDAFKGKLSDGQFGRTGETFRKAFKVGPAAD